MASLTTNEAKAMSRSRLQPTRQRRRLRRADIEPAWGPKKNDAAVVVCSHTLGADVESSAAAMRSSAVPRARRSTPCN
jgi:hypothetical protein